MGRGLFDRSEMTQIHVFLLEIGRGLGPYQGPVVLLVAGVGLLEADLSPELIQSRDREVSCRVDCRLGRLPGFEGLRVFW